MASVSVILIASLSLAPPAIKAAPPTAPGKLLSPFAKQAKSGAAEGASLPPGHRLLERPKQATTIDRFSLDELIAGLSENRWSASLAPDDDPLWPRSPFEHPSVRTLVARAQESPQSREDIVRAVRTAKRRATERKILQTLTPGDHEDDRQRQATLSRAAAFVLARLGDQAAIKELDQILLGDSSAPERIAAAHALAQWADRLDPIALGKLLDQWYPSDDAPRGQPGESRPRSRARFPDVAGPTARTGADIEASLLVAALVQLYVKSTVSNPQWDPTADPLVARAIATGNDAIRRAAAAGFSGRAWAPLPPLLVALLDDERPMVRRSALAALANCPTEAGRDRTLLATRDQSPEVREVAIASLPRFSGPKVVARVRELMISEKPRDRANALRAAAGIGLVEAVYAGVDDKVDFVREAAAAALAELPGPNPVKALSALLHDRSSGVQDAATRALAKRSDVEAMPVLLDGLDSPSLRTRQLAAASLETRWPEAGLFPAGGRADVRDERVKALRREWQVRAATIASAASATPRPPNIDNSQVRALAREWFEGKRPSPATLEKISALGPTALPVIESALLADGHVPDREFIAIALAPLDPVYAGAAALQKARSGRESGPVSDLVKTLKHRKLTEMQAVVLAEAIKHSAGVAPWKVVAPILERDQPRIARSLDQRGLDHAEAIIRQATCERIAQREEESLVDVTPLFRDRHQPVRVAAYKAAGRSRATAAEEGLRTALRSRDVDERLAAAASLSELGHADGWEEFQRLAHHERVDIRLGVIKALASDSRFQRAAAFDLLTRTLADEKLEVREAAIAALEKLTDHRYALDEAGKRVPLEEQLRRWKASIDQPARRPAQNPLAN